MKFGEMPHCIVILDWMTTELGIKSIYELLIYAIIYGFTQYGKEWKVDFEYISTAVRINKERVLRCLNGFENRGLILTRIEGGNMYVFVFGRK